MTVARRGCPAGFCWISGPGGGGLGTWARAPGRCPEQGEKKEKLFADQAEQERQVPACDKETQVE